MEFLDKLVLPQSSEHIALLHYILIIVQMLFIPFISIVLGGTAISIIYKRKGIDESNSKFLRFSNEIIDIVTINKGVSIILGIVPVLAAILIYTQLLHQTKADSALYLLISFFLITISLIFIFTYRYSLEFSRIFRNVKLEADNQEDKNEFDKMKYKVKSLSNKTGVFGVFLLFIALWIYVAAYTVALQPENYGKTQLIFSLFDWKVLSRFITFLAGAFTITGAVILYIYFYWDGGKKNLSDDYKDFVKRIGIYVTFIPALVIPVFMFINIFALPNSILSGAIFGYSVIALFLIFLAFHFLYAIIRQSKIEYSAAVFYTVLFTLIAIIISDQLTLSNATELHSTKLANDYQAYLNDLKGEETGGPEISGQEIYEIRCSSCHRFDTKLVGPPYDQTMPKYDGKKNQLISYILNPVKVNPDYPPMPNPGLTRPEAEAVATYLLETYKKE